MLLGVFLLWRRRLFEARWFLWILMLLLPFPYIANEAGWAVTEVGRQPWLVWGLLKTSQGISQTVVAGETIFTLLGFAGMYALISILFLFLVGREVVRGPDDGAAPFHRGGGRASAGALPHGGIAMPTFWFLVIGFLLSGYAIPTASTSAPASSIPLGSPYRGRAKDRGRRHRSSLGRQRSVADHQWRLALPGFPGSTPPASAASTWR